MENQYEALPGMAAAAGQEPLQILPLLPLRGVIVFPFMMMHLDVGREKSIKALEQAMLGNHQILLLAQKENEVEEPGAGDLYQVGTVAEIKQMLKLPGGNVRVLAEGLVRAELKEILSESPCLLARFLLCRTKRKRICL